MKYENPEPMPRRDVLAAFESGDESRIAQALIRAALYDERAWVEPYCRGYLDPRFSRDLRQIAATAISHLARLHREIDEETVEALVRTLTDDPEVGSAKVAIDDIQIYTRFGRRR